MSTGFTLWCGSVNQWGIGAAPNWGTMKDNLQIFTVLSIGYGGGQVAPRGGSAIKLLEQ
ncbi:hypothetical protein [Yersinia frederiksenii]|uniref:hypothetical protein n=1 Tax=Yersinia frederiksenii TaxID=29484 RepID=UPI000AA778AA|nr:hypothetical protein [Yersinia frederiksenii]